ncbi:MAG: glycosyltransferase N-terminal domain-containing protein, partial [Deltaproteobacteria bacterium]
MARLPRRLTRQPHSANPHHMFGLIFYRFIFIPLWIGWLLIREAVLILRGKTKASDLAQRLGKGPLTNAPVIWLHGASLGELGPAKVLAEAILDRRPDHDLIITAHAPHARDLVQSWGLERTHVSLAPLDMRWATRRFLSGFDCKLHITIENELWPNRFILLARKKVPIVAVSARMSARSLKQWRLMGDFPRRLMKLVTWLAAQAPDSRANLLALGLPEERVLPDLNLKALAPPKAPSEAELAPFVKQFDRDQTILGASTHLGE